MAELPSSPPGESAPAENALVWYKAQYEVLETDLADFKESSMELEKELERDIEEAEKRELALQKRLEGLADEVEEWKRKAKESKNEANSAQTLLEREITTLRDSNRTLQLKLRDIEVTNDDIERQARHTNSSLEDLESKYSSAVERAVLLEGEVKAGEQEREAVRIEAQRLKEELADVKIEADILHDRLRKHDAARLLDQPCHHPSHHHHLSSISTDQSVVESPIFDRNPVETSPGSTASSPLITSPPEERPSSPPSSPRPSTRLSAISTPSVSARPRAASKSITAAKAAVSIPRHAQRQTPVPVTPGPRSRPAARTSAGARPSGIGTAMRITSSVTTATVYPRTPAPTRAHTAVTAPRPRTSAAAAAAVASKRIPGATSLQHIRSLRAQMQQLQDHVNNVRSKMPPPPPPDPDDPDPDDHDDHPNHDPSRTPRPPATPATLKAPRHIPRLSTSSVPISRLSFGPLPSRARPDDPAASRPCSRASVASSASAARRPRSSLGRAPDLDDPYPRTPSRAGAAPSAIPPAPASVGPRRTSAAAAGWLRRASTGPRREAIDELGETY